MSLASFGVRRPVVANLFTGAIVIAGIVFGLGLRREFFPEVRPNEVIVSAPYPGASPDEIERSLAIKIEDKIDTIQNIKEINTTVSEGLANIRIEFEPGVDIDDAVGRVKRAVDELQDLPEESERLIVSEFEPNIPVISLTLYGDADERAMKRAIREMREDLRTLSGMGDVTIAGVRTDEIVVEVREEALVRHGVSLPAVAQRIREAMGELPGGAVRTPSANVGVRTQPFENNADAVRDIVIRADERGRPIRLGEIATVRDGFVDVELRTRFNNKPCVSLTAYARGSEDAVEMAGLVKAYAAGRERQPIHLSFVERFTARFDASGKPARQRAWELGASREPAPGLLATNNDLARFIQQRLELLTRNAVTGAVVVFLALMLFLRPRVAVWVTSGLIFSVLGTLILMRVFDISLNLLTMFGLIIAIGLLVDDAIVVAENIATRHEEGATPIDAGIKGANQVFWPVVATVLTTIFSFMPLRLIEGRFGDLLGALPLVVACALAASLLESFLILPSHMTESLIRADRKGGRKGRLSRSLDALRAGIFDRGLAPLYARALGPALRARWLTLALALSILIASIGMVAGGRLPFVFLVSADSESVLVPLTMPIGTPLARTDEVVRRIEAAALDTPEIQSVFSLVGGSFDLEGAPGVNQSHLAQLFIELRPVEERDRRSDQVIQAIRSAVGPLPGVKSLRFQEVQGGPSGRDLAFTIASEDPSRIPAIEASLRALLEAYDGVFDLSTDADTGQRELRLTLREGASEMGFTVGAVAQQMRAAVFGLEAYTFAGQREDVDVRVMIDEPTRRSLAAIESMRVFTPPGAGPPRAVPLGEVVEIREDQGYATLRRLDRRRAVTVSADVDKAVANPEQIAAAIAPDIRRLQDENPGVSIIPRGRQEDVAESLRTLPLGLMAAIGLNYVILVWLFSSYTQPLIILIAIPFSMVGAIWAHLLLGYEMTMLSLIGFVALAGIVVNDSIVFMEFYNHHRAGKPSAYDACVVTGPRRLRAIILTTLTTFLGLSPLMLETSFQAQFLIPMAITISFGLVAGTFQTLFVLPALLCAGEDVRRWLRWV
ncbi:MAG: efflux RND transporter permease subunit, partial [Phycisphaerales bacterium]|nr:efflux RND transporter permease subunit [Phycisphaerales bacterium]